MQIKTTFLTVIFLFFFLFGCTQSNAPPVIPVGDANTDVNCAMDVNNARCLGGQNPGGNLTPPVNPNPGGSNVANFDALLQAYYANPSHTTYDVKAATSSINLTGTADFYLKDGKSREDVQLGASVQQLFYSNGKTTYCNGGLCSGIVNGSSRSDGPTYEMAKNNIISATPNGTKVVMTKTAYCFDLVTNSSIELGLKPLKCYSDDGILLYTASTSEKTGATTEFTAKKISNDVDDAVFTLPSVPSRALDETTCKLLESSDLKAAQKCMDSVKSYYGS